MEHKYIKKKSRQRQSSQVVVWFLGCAVVLLGWVGVVSAVKVTLHNATAFPVHARWNFGIFGSDTRMIPALGEAAVSKPLLHTGFQDVYITSARVGDVWGKDPDTGADLVLTESMIDSKGAVWGVRPANLYHAPAGQALYHHFLLLIEAVQNRNDNDRWWPRFRIIRQDKDIFVQMKDKIVGFFNGVSEYGGEGIAVLHALAQHKPITGFILTKADVARDGYVSPSSQPNPPSVAQERATLMASIASLDDELEALGHEEGENLPNQEEEMAALRSQKEELRRLYGEELALVDAIIKYSPVVYLHPDDLARPIDPRDFFAGETTAVRQGDHAIQKRVGFFTQKSGDFTIPSGQVTFKKLSDLTKNNPSTQYYIWHGIPSQQNRYDRRIFYGSNPAYFDQGAVPMHVVTFYDRIPIGTDQKGNTLYKKDTDDYYVPNKDFFYLQYLFLYGYNQPYDIKIPMGTLYRGDVHDFQNAHEGDLEHMTMKIDAKTGKLAAIFYGSHGSDEGIWMYPPGSTGNMANEFSVENGRPVVYVAFGGHGTYPKEGVYTRVFGFANDHTKKGPLWKMTENSLFRTVRPESAGFNPLIHTANPDHFGYLDWRGFLGHRGVTSFIEKQWAGNSEGEDKGRDAVIVHRNHFCPAATHSTQCVRDKSEASPPPGGKWPWYIEMLQALGLI